MRTAPLLALLAACRPAPEARTADGPAGTGATLYVSPDPGPGRAIFPSIEAALAEAEPGDRIVVGAGTYEEDLVVAVDGLTIEAAGDRPATLRTEAGLRVSATDTTLRGLALVSLAAEAAIALDPGAELAMDGVTVEAAGLALDVDGGTLAVDRSRVDGGPVLLRAGDGAVVTAADTLFRGSPLRSAPPSIPGSTSAEALPDALVTATGDGTAVVLSHAALVDAPVEAVAAGDGARVRLEDSIVAAVGTDPTALDEPAVRAEGEAAVELVSCLVQGPAFTPHAAAAAGAVTVEDPVDGWPGLASPTSGQAALVISVDDGPNLDHAVDLSRVMDDWGFRLTWFASGTRWFADEEAEAMRDLVARGHQVGCHTQNHPILVRRAPIALTWRGHRGGRLRIEDEGTRLVVEQRTAGGWRTVAGPWALDSEELHTTGELCEALDALPQVDCVLVEDASGSWTWPSELAEGELELPPRVAVPVPYDRRLPDEGGRFFATELVDCRAALEEVIDEPVTALAYPGQKHDALVEEAAAQAGFAVARGSAGLSGSTWLVHAGLDRLASPMSLTVDEVKGEGYDDLDRAGREARIRGFVRTWGTAALEAGMVGALTIHTAETFDADELDVLLDEAVRVGLPVMDMAELDAWLDEAAEPLDDRTRALPWADRGDPSPAEDSDAVDAGRDAGRRVDALGRPIYGLPDLGPYEFQPTRDIRREGAGPGGRARVYADGRFRALAPERTLLPSLRVVPAAIEDFSDDEPRPALLDFALGDRSRRALLAARVEPAGEGLDACAVLDGLLPDTPYRLRVRRSGAAPGARGWREAGIVRADGAGRASFDLAVDGPLRLELAVAAGADGSPLPACAPEDGG